MGETRMIIIKHSPGTIRFKPSGSPRVEDTSVVDFKDQEEI